MTLGEKLRTLRKEKGLTIENLASELDSNYSTISMYEINKRKPDYDMIKKIADYFDVTTDYLLGRSHERRGYALSAINKMIQEGKLKPTDTLSDILNKFENSNPNAKLVADEKVLYKTSDTETKYIDNTFTTLAAHHDGTDYSEEELAEIEDFKKYVLSKRKH